MKHTDQNSLKASAYLLGISVEELIDVLNNASQIKEIRTTSGFPLSLPTRTSQTQPASKVGDAEHKGRRVDTPVPQEPSDANANEHQRDRLIAELADLKSTADRFKAEVERLRKAGIAMGMCLPDTDEANKAYRDFEAGGKS